MSGSAAMDIDIRGLERVQRAMLAVSRTRFQDLAEVIGTEVESQTKRRLEEEKRAPDGQPWPPWSPRYAATRHDSHSLLQNEDHLLDSIQYVADMPDVEVGSNLEYAGVHNEGSEDGTIPQRQYIGMSSENENELLDAVDDFLEGALSDAGLR